MKEFGIEFLPGYWITSEGEVFSTARNWGSRGLRRKLSQHIDHYGYLNVMCAMPTGEQRRFYIHALLAKHYLPPKPSPLHEVRHLDGVPTNNALANLAWGTEKDNAADRTAHGRTFRGETHPEAKLTDDAVRQIRFSIEQGETRGSVARRFSVSPGCIDAVSSRRSWRHVL